MNFLKIKALVVVIIGLFVFSGCSQYEQALLADALVNNQPHNQYNDDYYYNSYYRDGKLDGCKSRRYGYTVKSSYKWRHYRSYRNGWYRGYDTCRRRVDHGHNYYNKGYRDGCWSKRYHSIRKNRRLYNTNHTYRNGWIKGYRNCRIIRYR